MVKMLKNHSHKCIIYSQICLMVTPHKGDNCLMGTNWQTRTNVVILGDLTSFIGDKPSVVRGKDKSVLPLITHFLVYQITKLPM